MTEIPNELIEKIENINEFYARFIKEEQLASSAVTYCSNVLPGPLQTRDTARAITRFYRRGNPEDVIDTIVEARMSRAKRLLGAQTLSSYFVPEHILYLREVKTPEQIDHLINMSCHPSVDLRIVPNEELHRAKGATTLLEFNDKDPIVYIEDSAEKDKFIEDRSTVGEFQEVFSGLAEISMNNRDSSYYLREFRN